VPHATGSWHPLWSRSTDNGGGMIMGSAAPSWCWNRVRMPRRVVRIYATIDAVEGDRGSATTAGSSNASSGYQCLPWMRIRPRRWSFPAQAD
jgi:hypothetical protein